MWRISQADRSRSAAVVESHRKPEPIGSNSVATGTVMVTGAASSWANTQDLFLGVFGTGTLKVLQGAHVDNQGASLGHIDGTGNVLVEGAGSQWTSRGDVFVGNGAKGTLTIDQQGSVHSRAAWVGLNTTAVGSVVVDGAQSKWEIDRTLTLGDSAGSGAAILSLTGAGSRVSIGAAQPRTLANFPIRKPPSRFRALATWPAWRFTMAINSRTLEMVTSAWAPAKLVVSS